MKSIRSEKTKNRNERAYNLKLVSIGSVIILLVIILAANILFDKLLGKALTFDFSSLGKYSISQTTKEVIDKIPESEPMRIVGLFERPTNFEYSIYEYIVPLIDVYDNYAGSKISVEYVDPETYPSIIKQLDPADVYDLKSDTYVISYGDKLVVVDPYDCFYWNEDALKLNQLLPTANMVEYTFTNTINQLMVEFTKKAYFVTGLQEDASINLMSILSSIQCDSAELPVSEGFKIPDDCDLLILNGINADIPERVQEEMKTYLSKGGKLFVAVNFYSNASEKYEHLNSVLATVNISIDDCIIQEADPSYVLVSTNYEAYVDIADEFKSFIDNASKLQASYARPIRQTDVLASNAVSYPVLTTSDNAKTQIVKDNALELANEGKYNVGMYATYSSGDIRPEVYVFGTTDLSSDAYISSYGYSSNNISFTISCFRNMLNVAPGEYINVPVGQLDSRKIDSTRVTATSITLLAIVFVAIVPLLFIICATIVYNRRRHL